MIIYCNSLENSIDAKNINIANAGEGLVLVQITGHLLFNDEILKELETIHCFTDSLDIFNLQVIKKQYFTEPEEKIILIGRNIQ